MDPEIEARGRRAVLRACAGAALATSPALSASRAHAQAAYPERPVRIVVPYPVGGATDVLARDYSERLAKRFGQPFVVENRAGASGVIGTDAVAKSKPDGHTLVLTITQSVLTNQFLFSKLPYDPRRDLEPVAILADAQGVLLVNPAVPARDLAELRAHLGRHRGQVAYGSWGPGSTPHLIGSYLSRVTGSDMVHVTYKGEAPLLQDLAAGQVQVALTSILSARPLIEAGRLKPIAVSGERRSAALADVPTFEESGMPDAAFKILSWFAVFAPASTPVAVVQALSDALVAITRLPEIEQRMASLGLRPVGADPARSREIYGRDWPVLKQLVEASGARLD